MAIAEALLPEFDHEMATTRRLLERVPMEHGAWKPHARSMSLAELATHIADLPAWSRNLVDAPFYDLVNNHAHRPAMQTQEELLATFDANVAYARGAIGGKSDAELKATWSLRRGRHELFSAPRAAVVRRFLMNHLIHHRGQLSVYLRLRDVPLPALYGPSADERA